MFFFLFGNINKLRHSDRLSIGKSNFVDGNTLRICHTFGELLEALLLIVCDMQKRVCETKLIQHNRHTYTHKHRYVRVQRTPIE